ncbi:MAG: hypothetical protein NTZ78_14235 [Candidatus Aureabacteria bacterium]|nr:hypothetical protein [Candidatus Auribacterota bacterium]
MPSVEITLSFCPNLNNDAGWFWTRCVAGAVGKLHGFNRCWYGRAALVPLSGTLCHPRK